MEGECLCYGGGPFNGGSKIMLGGQFNRGRMVMGELLCYGGGHFNGVRMVMLQRWSLMEGEWLCYRGVY